MHLLPSNTGYGPWPDIILPDFDGCSEISLELIMKIWLTVTIYPLRKDLFSLASFPPATPIKTYPSRYPNSQISLEPILENQCLPFCDIFVLHSSLQAATTTYPSGIGLSTNESNLDDLVYVSNTQAEITCPFLGFTMTICNPLKESFWFVWSRIEVPFKVI